jgi:hypothetical protein
MLRASTTAVMLLISGILFAQSNPESPTATLGLLLLPGGNDNASPQAFIVRLINHSEHNIWVPEPAVQCSDTIDGYVRLRVQLPNGASSGYECVLDHYRLPVLDRIQKWKVLEPGAMIEETIPRAKLHYDAGQSGTYEFWAEYYPPALNAAEQQLLRERGIDFSLEKLASPHLTFSTTARPQFSRYKSSRTQLHYSPH